MRLRLLRWCVATAIVVAVPGVMAHGQNSGMRGNSYNVTTPFADLGRHARDSSPLGTMDGSVNQSIGLEAEGRFSAEQPSSAGLDQLQPSPRGGGQRSALASTGGFSADAGARKLIASQAYTKSSSEAYNRPSYLAGPRLTSDGITDPSRLTASKPIGLTGTPMGSTGSRALQAGRDHGAQYGGENAPRRVAAHRNSPSSIGAHGAGSVDVTAPPAMLYEQSPFEKLGDPFRSASATGFESFGTRSAFDRPCGDACAFRSSGGSDPFGGGGRGSRERNRLGETPETRVPDADTKVQSGQGLKLP